MGLLRNFFWLVLNFFFFSYIMTTIRNQAVVFQSYLSADGSFNTDAHIGSNLNNTPMLSTVPSAVSTSEGTYLFKHSTGKAQILNASGSKSDTSFEFVSVSSSSLPKVMANLSNTGLTIGNVKVESDEVKIGSLSVKSTLDAHTEQISSLTAFDVRELVKISQMDALDVALGGRINVNESDIVALKAKDVVHETEIASLKYADTLQLGRTSVLETDMAKAKSDILNLAAVDVTELAKISDLEARDLVHDARFVVDEAKIEVLEKKQPIIVSQPIYATTPAVYADSALDCFTYIPASLLAVTSYSGIYVQNTANKKVNFYIPPDKGMSVADLKGLMLSYYNNSSTLTGLAQPFVAVYTKTDALTANAASWYKSRKTFCYEYTAPAVKGESYALFANLKSLPYDPVAYSHTKVAATNIPGNDRGPFADSEQILFFSIGTASNSAAGLFDCIISKFSLFTDKATHEFVFQPK